MAHALQLFGKAPSHDSNRVRSRRSFIHNGGIRQACAGA
jgi:hypothetical protein